MLRRKLSIVCTSTDSDVRKVERILANKKWDSFFMSEKAQNMVLSAYVFAFMCAHEFFLCVRVCVRVCE